MLVSHAAAKLDPNRDRGHAFRPYRLSAGPAEHGADGLSWGKARTVKTVWKFKIPYQRSTEFKFEVPQGSVPLRVDFDPSGDLCVWMQVDTERVTSEIEIAIAGTGEPIPDGFDNYINTFMRTPYVFHAYAKTGKAS